MSDWPVRTFHWEEQRRSDGSVEQLLTREWLVTNGLGGYASGTVGGVPTRRYHGMLIAALPAPLGRMLLLSNLTERIRTEDGRSWTIGGQERAEGLELDHEEALTEFVLEAGLPVWRYRHGDVVIEKRLFIPHEQNSSYIQYCLLEGADRVRLKLMPHIQCRSHDAAVSTPLPETWTVSGSGDRYEINWHNNVPLLKLMMTGAPAAFTVEAHRWDEVLYRIEGSRGYDLRGSVASPGYFRTDLVRGVPVTLIASTEPWTTIEAMSPRDVLENERQRRVRLIQAADPALHEGVGAELVLAADQFLIRPVSRLRDDVIARASGDEARTVIAGYHWFTDWGRDTMISFEGLTLCTGRHAEARWILRTFAQHIRDGLIPNLFPEGGTDGLYHTADATLWFFHALDRYRTVTGDDETVMQLIPALREIVDKHIAGTRFGIGVDPEDGLLRQGAEGYQLTWMDAKVGDWVVTPRRGKAVEINALWYNALRLLEGWLSESGDAAAAEEIGRHAARTEQSFAPRFWYEEGQYLYDVVDGETGDDSSLRPNQVFSIALKHPVLQRDRWEPVLDAVQNRLLTPLGLRTLAPGHPDYKSNYAGDLRARDAAYHQGTVWAWLIGPYLDAWIKLHPEVRERAEARELLTGLSGHLSEACLGSISEIFDAEAPYWPRGCIAQAWSIAELIRCWIKTDGRAQ